MLKNRLSFRFLLLQISVYSIYVLSPLNAQSNRFSAGIIGGVNLSQISGDKHQGYNKVGLSLGLNGIINLQKNFNLSLELGYNQRGSKSGEIDRNRIEFGIHPFNLQLNYAEVLFAPNLFFYETYDDYYRFRFTAGISFLRLINTSVEETIFNELISEDPIVYKELLDDISKNDLNGVVGLTFFINEKIGIELRQGIGLKPIYQANNTRLLVYYLSLRGSYIF